MLMSMEAQGRVWGVGWMAGAMRASWVWAVMGVLALLFCFGSKALSTDWSVLVTAVVIRLPTVLQLLAVRLSASLL